MIGLCISGLKESFRLGTTQAITLKIRKGRMFEKWTTQVDERLLEDFSQLDTRLHPFYHVNLLAALVSN